MHNLIQFFIKNSYWFLFILLEVVAFYFIFSDNAYQRSVFLNSSNQISGNIYATSSSINSYFGLKNENEKLLEMNGYLKNRISVLENQIFELEKDSLQSKAILEQTSIFDNQYIVARVINNSVSKTQNYITINKGSKDGIKEGMGVISTEGIVGEVRAVSSNFSVIQSLLNSHSQFSTKLINSNAFGPLIWKAEDPRYAIIEEYPSHEKVAIGDTVVTSGYSDVFPSNILVGVVDTFELKPATNQYMIKVKLATDFYAIKNVLVVKRDYIQEKLELEEKLTNAKN